MSTNSFSAVFTDIYYYKEALGISRSASHAGEHMYPDLMEALPDIAGYREIIAAEIAENTKWLINDVER